MNLHMAENLVHRYRRDINDAALLSFSHRLSENHRWQDRTGKIELAYFNKILKRQVKKSLLREDRRSLQISAGSIQENIYSSPAG